jgi:LmbE family N-acetylglucosaminyl deacetylase
VLDLLVITAHPDDEILVAGPLIAAAAISGRTSVIVCATDGGAGVNNGTEFSLDDDLVSIRQRELQCAALALGAEGVKVLGYRDGGSSGEVEAAMKLTNRLDEASIEIEELIADLRPTTVITHGQDDPDCHPDHLALSKATQRAVESVKVKGLCDPTLYFSAFPDAARRKIVNGAIKESRQGSVDMFKASMTSPTGCDLEVILTEEIRARILNSINCHKSQQRSLLPLRDLLSSDVGQLALGFNTATQVP